MEKIFNNVFDIKFTNDQCYLLKHNTLTTQQIRQEVSRFPPYQLGYPRDAKVENAKLPPVIFFFYKKAFDEQSTPHPDVLLEKYLACGEFAKVPDTPDAFRLKSSSAVLPLEGIRGRFMRTYPSLLRDFYLYYLLKESHYFDTVAYSLKADYIGGVDLAVTKGGLTAHINVYLDSINSHRQRSGKDARMGRHKDTAIKELELIFTSTLRQNINNYFLPNRRCLDVVISMFDDLQKDG